MTESQQPRKSEADQLWAALDMKEGDQVVEAMLIGKLVNFENGRVEISISVTDGVDWIGQLGLLAAAQLMSDQTPVLGSGDD